MAPTHSPLIKALMTRFSQLSILTVNPVSATHVVRCNSLRNLTNMSPLSLLTWHVSIGLMTELATRIPALEDIANL